METGRLLEKNFAIFCGKHRKDRTEPRPLKPTGCFKITDTDHWPARMSSRSLWKSADCVRNVAAVFRTRLLAAGERLNEVGRSFRYERSPLINPRSAFDDPKAFKPVALDVLRQNQQASRNEITT